MTRIVTYPVIEDELAIVLSCKADGTFGLKIGFGDEEEEFFGKRRDLRIRVKELVKAIGVLRTPLPEFITDGEPPPLPEQPEVFPPDSPEEEVEPESATEERVPPPEQKVSPKAVPKRKAEYVENGTDRIRNGLKRFLNGGEKVA